MATSSYIHLSSRKPPPILSLPPFKAVLVAEEASDSRWRDTVSEWLIKSGCLYACAWGNACEAWHDSIDWANIADFPDGRIPDTKLVMTTWHDADTLSEAFWFVGVCAEHPTIKLQHTLIVHIAACERGDELLRHYRHVIAC